MKKYVISQPERDERKRWKLRRISNDIKLSGELDLVLECSYNNISLWERGHSNMDEQKVIKYKRYIEMKETEKYELKNMSRGALYESIPRA